MNARTKDRLVLDVRDIPGSERHATIPLRFQFESHSAGRYSWDYLDQGPREYCIRITRK